MTTVSSFIAGVSATVRDLVASGKAVPVTNETAAELDLLAGLPWADALLHDPSSEDGTDFRCNRCGVGLNDEDIGQRITPADLALGWLLASRAVVSADEEGAWNNTLRAAECAELAAISASHVVNGRLALECLGTDNPLRTTEAHDGTREGARAAWGFVVEQLTRSADSIEENTRKPDANIDRFAGRRLLCADRYRRELEAM